MTNTSTRCVMFALGCVAGALGAHVLQAQQSGIQRVILQRADIAQSQAPLEAVMGTAEIQSGSTAGRHTHPGMEMGYVLAGEISFEIEGEVPRALKAGDSYVIATGKVHDAKAIGPTAAKVLAVYLIEKGKPLATAAQ